MTNFKTPEELEQERKSAEAVGLRKRDKEDERSSWISENEEKELDTQLDKIAEETLSTGEFGFDYEKFFDDCGGSDLKLWGQLHEEAFSVEDLFQAFKARIIYEAQVDIVTNDFVTDYELAREALEAGIAVINDALAATNPEAEEFWNGSEARAMVEGFFAQYIRALAHGEGI